MDLEDYKTLDVPGKFTGLKEKDDVRYVRIGEKLYIL